MSDKQAKIVLIVDDNRDAADTLALLVRHDGHSAIVAYDAEIGFELAQKTSPDIIFHDLGMPKMNGYDAVRRLRADMRFAKTLMVAVTAYDSIVDRMHSAEAGFDVHLAKPVQFEVIKKLLG